MHGITVQEVKHCHCVSVANIILILKPELHIVMISVHRVQTMANTYYHILKCLKQSFYNAMYDFKTSKIMNMK